MKLGNPIALDCPECGRIRWIDEDGCCAQCGLDCSWLYPGVRLSPEGQPITRVQWYRIVADRAAEYGHGYVTPALAQVCKTLIVGQAAGQPKKGVE